MEKLHKRNRILGIPFEPLTFDRAIDLMMETARKRPRVHQIIFTPNVHHHYLYHHDSHFKKAYEASGLSLIDGMPLVWACRLLNGQLVEKVSGSDVFIRLFKEAYDKDMSIFLLGAGTGVAETAALKLSGCEVLPLDRITCYSPPLGFEKDTVENQKVVNMINEAKPDILFVALGAPKQEFWLYEHAEKLDTGIALGVGGSFDFVAGTQKRAPVVLQNIGLEWAYRLCSNPRRLFMRYLVTNSFFCFRVVKEMITSATRESGTKKGS